MTDSGYYSVGPVFLAELQCLLLILLLCYFTAANICDSNDIGKEASVGFTRV